MTIEEVLRHPMGGVDVLVVVAWQQTVQRAASGI